MRFTALALIILVACGDTSAISPGRLTARPSATASTLAPGRSTLHLGAARDGVLYVPARKRPAYPLMLLLHGAHGSGERIERRMHDLADRYSFIVLAPDSRGGTWDVLSGDIGPDVAFIDRALRDVFSRCPVDAAHVAIAGFSDGASYALSLGVANGDLFKHVMAFSPGFMNAPSRQGRPRFFLSHGTEDEILPIDRASRALVPALRGVGFEVRYREFDGPHTVPPEVAQEAVEWWLSGTSTRAGAE